MTTQNENNDSAGRQEGRLSRGSGFETILLAGRDPLVRARLREVLSAQDYTVIEAINDRHAATILAELGPRLDLVVVDLGFDAANAPHPEWLREIPAIPMLVLFKGSIRDNFDTTAASIEYQTSYQPQEILNKVREVLDASEHKDGILVVDEDQFARSMITASLEEAGYRVSEATDGKQALRVLAKQKTKVVITELVLPQFDGLQLIQELRKSSPETKIIAVSGARYAETYLRMARAMGAQATLHKRHLSEKLVESVREVFESD